MGVVEYADRVLRGLVDEAAISRVIVSRFDSIIYLYTTLLLVAAGCAGVCLQWPTTARRSLYRAPRDQGDVPKSWHMSIDVANTSWDDGWSFGLA